MSFQITADRNGDRVSCKIASIAIILKPDTFNVELHIRLETAWRNDFNGELPYLLTILLPATVALHNTILPVLPNIKQSVTLSAGVKINCKLFADAISF
jgi:hypothetical protein